jgi:8-hydroxy-5-deazaflavin:NADPH oxidoreductase
MKISVLGTGVVGRKIAERLVQLQHEVTIGTRDPDATLEKNPEVGQLLAQYPGLTLLSFDEAAAGAALVVHAGNGAAAIELLSEVGSQQLAGKVLIDISNPLDFSAGFPPTLFCDGSESLAERIQDAFPDTHVVKSLNTLTAELMVHPENLPEPTTVFVSGNNADAKVATEALLRELGHRDIFDLGDLSTARGTEQYLYLWLRMFGKLGTGIFNIRVVR